MRARSLCSPRHCMQPEPVRISAPSDLASSAKLLCVCGSAEVAKLVDAPDLGSSAARRESSSLSFRTILGRRSVCKT